MTDAIAGKPSYGTLAWAEANDGRLSRREQFRESGKAFGTLLRNAPGQLRTLTGQQVRNALKVDLDTLTIPDSTIARDAVAECHEHSADSVVQHSHRMYLWAMMLAKVDGLKPDPETTFVACMLHDIAWSDRYRDYSPMPCFGARGAQLARDWSIARGWDIPRALLAADAISLHMNVSVGTRYSPEAQAVAAAAGLDVLGLRYCEIDRATIQAVVARHPRDNWLENLENFRIESHPRTRAQLMRRLGLLQMNKHTPFGDKMPKDRQHSQPTTIRATVADDKGNTR